MLEALKLIAAERAVDLPSLDADEADRHEPRQIRPFDEKSRALRGRAAVLDDFLPEAASPQP
jgi:hypothetical protein